MAREAIDGNGINWLMWSTYHLRAEVLAKTPRYYFLKLNDEASTTYCNSTGYSAILIKKLKSGCYSQVWGAELVTHAPLYYVVMFTYWLGKPMECNFHRYAYS